MRNCNVLITGLKGSGKTTLARSLFLRAPRAVVIDPLDDYGAVGRTVYGLKDAITHISEFRDEDYRLVFRPEWDAAEEANLLLKFIHNIQLKYNAPPIAIGLEEVTTYGETHKLLFEVKRAYNMGRHARLNIVSIIQMDTDIHRTVRFNTDIIVAMQQHKLSTDMARHFSHEQTQDLTILTPGVTPVKGTHYLTSPPKADLFDAWDRALALPVG